MAVEPVFTLFELRWSCTNRTVCGWQHMPSAQNIDTCPRCGCRDIEVVYPPIAEAAWRLGGWEAVWEIHAERLRTLVQESYEEQLAVFVRTRGRK